MPMLRRMMELGCSLIDYEKITDDAGRRLVFFGRFAGIAGMVDTLAGLGQRLKRGGHRDAVLPACRLAHEYGRVALAKAAIAEVGRDVVEQGLPAELSPFIVGVTGYGHVAKGAWEMLDALGATEVEPVDLPALAAARGPALDLPRDVPRGAHGRAGRARAPVRPEGVFREAGAVPLASSRSTCRTCR